MAHTLRISELYAPELHTVRLEPSGLQYQLPRGLICAKSEYFNSAFKKHYSEGQNGAITLDDVTPWVFEVFISWLYTDRIFWDPGDQPDPSFDAPKGQQDNHHENDKANAITWHWRKLFDLFIFADKYDTKALRNAIMVIVQVKAQMQEPRDYLLPSFQEAAYAFENLPSNSPLYRYIIDGFVHSRCPDSLVKASDLLVFPAETLTLLLVKSLQENCRANCKACNAGEPCNDRSHMDTRGKIKPYFNTPCHYHEHRDEDESRECYERFERLNEQHILNLKSTKYP